MLPQHEFTDVLKQWPVTPQDTHCHRHIRVSCIWLLRINTSRSLSQNQLLNSSLGLFHFWNVAIPAKPPEFVGSAALRAMQHSSSLPSLEGRCSRLVESALYVARGLGVEAISAGRGLGFSKIDSPGDGNFLIVPSYRNLNTNNWLAIGLNDEILKRSDFPFECYSCLWVNMLRSGNPLRIERDLWCTTGQVVAKKPLLRWFCFHTERRTFHLPVPKGWELSKLPTPDSQESPLYKDLQNGYWDAAYLGVGEAWFKGRCSNLTSLRVMSFPLRLPMRFAHNSDGSISFWSAAQSDAWHSKIWTEPQYFANLGSLSTALRKSSEKGIS